MFVAYAGQLVLAGSLRSGAAYEAVFTLPRMGYTTLNPWLHSKHGHLLENAIVFALLGYWTEKRVGSQQFVVAVLATGYLTNLIPPVFGFGGLGLGASGITNALWANFTIGQFVAFQDAIQEDSPVVHQLILHWGLLFVGLLFVLRSIAEFFGLIPHSPGTAIGAHVLGVALGIGWFICRRLRC